MSNVTVLPEITTMYVPDNKKQKKLVMKLKTTYEINNTKLQKTVRRQTIHGRKTGGCQTYTNWDVCTIYPNAFFHRGDYRSLSQQLSQMSWGR